MKLAFGYIRRSSYKQIDNNSVEIQKSHILEYAQRKNFHVPEDFFFIEEATSAYSKPARQRKQLMRLKAKMIEMNIPRLIFYDESRMDRTGYTFVTQFFRPLCDGFEEPVELYTTNSEEPFNPNDPKTSIALLLYRQESEIKSERALGSLVSFLETKDDDIRPGARAPYGFKQVNKRLILNPKQAEVVSLIFYLQSWGVSLNKISLILNEAEIPSPLGNLWRSGTLETILKNPIYTGVLKWAIRKGKHKNEYEYKDFMEPVVDEFLVQLNSNNIKLQKQYGRLDTPFTLLNKVHCRHCHEKLITQNGSTKRNGHKYSYQYYVCKTCNYKLDIQDLHGKVIPKILQHVQDVSTNEQTKSETVDYLTNVEKIIGENIVHTEQRINAISSKGSIAKERQDWDRELELQFDLLQSRYQNDLEALMDSKQHVQELLPMVEDNHFFLRFNQLLESQFGDTEMRLIMLYFVDKIIVSPNHPVRIIYHDNPFTSFDFPVVQTTEN